MQKFLQSTILILTTLFICAPVAIAQSSGTSTHTAPGDKATLEVDVGTGNAADANEIDITTPVGTNTLSRYVGTGTVPPGSYRITGQGTGSREIEFGTAPPADATVEIKWEWPSGSPPPSVSDGNWS